MTREVVQLDDHRPDPHLGGEAVCFACKHKWAAVCPVGVLWLECPSCTLLRGRLVHPVRTDTPHWTCACGSEVFHLTEMETYCCNCGEEVVGWP